MFKKFNVSIVDSKLTSMGLDPENESGEIYIKLDSIASFRPEKLPDSDIDCLEVNIYGDVILLLDVTVEEMKTILNIEE
jgi:hypothetical protein